MAITVVANPATLSWANFRTTPNKIPDPGDGTLQDSLTKFDYTMPDLPPRMVDGQFALADPNVITITPNAQVFSGVAKTPRLLAHEQFHYDVGIVIARAFARAIMRLRAPSKAALIAALQNAVNLHFQTRAGLIQHRYDLDTHHGTIAHYQRIWKSEMVACLAHPHSDHLHGFWL